MEKEILEALTAKFEGVSASILGRIAARLAKTATTAEQVKTAVEGVTIQQVIESYGDSRATEASETARKNAVRDYESRHGLKDGAKVTPEPPQAAAPVATPAGGADETPSWAKTLIERLDRLETARTTDSRTQRLNAVIDRLPENLRKAYMRIPVESYSEEDFTKMLGEITTEVEGIADDTAARGAVFGRPSASAGQVRPTELTEAQKAAISHREGVPAPGTQPF